ncbi:MAG: hypothetical protein Q4C70_09855, partial [Planctomycetia bacterium]|nr:hypothetical protein [Planctomycetia bacterium]
MIPVSEKIYEEIREKVQNIHAQEMPTQLVLRGRVVGFLGSFCLFLMLAGCTSSVFHEGAYVGNGGTCDLQARPAAVPHSSVPFFASRDVKNDAKNRVAMERATGRPVAARPATVNDVIAWHQSGVHSSNIITHIRTHGLYQPIQGQDVLTLQNRGVSTDVIRTMKEHPYPKVDAPVPPPSNQPSAFSGASSNPDTNPGNGYYAGAGNSGPNIALAPSASVPTLAPPVLPASATGQERTPRTSTLLNTFPGGTVSGPQYGIISPQCGTCVSDISGMSGMSGMSSGAGGSGMSGVSGISG